MPQKNWLDMIVFNNKIPEDNDGSYPGIAAKDIEIYVSDISAKSGFTKVAAFRLENNKNNQFVKILPVQAKWIKFVITSNYGNPNYTELGRLGIFDNKTRLINISDEMNKQGYIDLYGLYFDFGSAELKAESEPSIQQIVDYLNQNKEVKILIEGHTDNVGSEVGNLKLSEDRANRVKSELIKKGISSDKLSVLGMGSKKPVADNTTDFGRAQNRRVTIRKI
jgi:outer membrane protein OmpA-like peptidoglycan-associated protein